MQVSKKQKTLSLFFGPFLKFASNFKHFENINDPPSLCMSDIMECETRG